MNTINSKKDPFGISGRQAEKRHDDGVEHWEPVGCPADEVDGGDEDGVDDDSADGDGGAGKDTFVGVQLVDELQVEVDDEDQRNHVAKDEGSGKFLFFEFEGLKFNW